MDKIERMRQQQSDNIDYEKERMEMGREAMIKRMEDKHVLAKVAVENRYNGRREVVASMNRREAFLIKEALIKRYHLQLSVPVSMKSQTKGDEYKCYLTEMESAPISRIEQRSSQASMPDPAENQQL